MIRQINTIFSSSSVKRLTLGVFFILCSATFVVGQGGIRTVVIDAGHGGKDPGNLGTGRYKTKEKDIALSVSLKLGSYIKEAFPETKVIYTRKDDSFITLSKRAEIANSNKADLFISIHCNAAKSKEAAGTETFVMGFKYAKENLSITKMENSVIFLEDDYKEKYADFDPNNPEADMYAALYQSAFQDQSITFANYVEQQFSKRVGRRSRGVKQGVLYVLNRSSMPSVLVELGFLSNRNEEEFLNSELGQVYMASAIYRAFKDFKKQRESVDGIREAPIMEPAREEEVVEKEYKDNPYDISFHIQLLSSAKPIDPSKNKELKSIDSVQELELNGRYKYVYGNYPSYDDAKAALRKIKKDGFSSAFVIALKNNEQLSMKDALKEQK